MTDSENIDYVHAFRPVLGSNNCLKCNLDISQASLVPCNPIKTFKELMNDLTNELNRLCKERGYENIDDYYMKKGWESVSKND